MEAEVSAEAAAAAVSAAAAAAAAAEEAAAEAEDATEAAGCATRLIRGHKLVGRVGRRAEHGQ